MSRRLLLALLVGMIATAALPAATEANTRYTGCLHVGGKLVGRITEVWVGIDPFQPCTGQSGEITWLKVPERGAKGDRGPRGNPGRRGSGGDPGANGETGDRGAPGTAGSFALYTVMSPCQSCEGNDTEMTAAATCDVGDVALGGGFITDGLVFGSVATDEGGVDGWSTSAVVASENSNGSRSQLICHDLPPLRR